MIRTLLVLCDPPGSAWHAVRVTAESDEERHAITSCALALFRCDKRDEERATRGRLIGASKSAE